MTKQVRTVYRSHRRAAWVVALALVGTVAAVVIPIASGAGDKTYSRSATLAISPVTCLHREQHHSQESPTPQRPRRSAPSSVTSRRLVRLSSAPRSAAVASGARSSDATA